MTAGAAANALHILLRLGQYDQVITKGLPELGWVEQHGYPASWAGQLLRGTIIQALPERGRLDEAVILSAAADDENPSETLLIDRALLTAVTGSSERAIGLWRDARDLVLRLPGASLTRDPVACGVEIAIWAPTPGSPLRRDPHPRRGGAYRRIALLRRTVRALGPRLRRSGGPWSCDRRRD